MSWWNDAVANPMLFAFPTYPQYRTGKTLGSGTYAIVKEAVHIKTGKYYACKVINKKLMEGREYMVRLSWAERFMSMCARVVFDH